MRVCCVFLIVLAFLISSTANCARADEKGEAKKVILHEEWAGLLFDWLELAKEDAIISVPGKIAALSEYNFQPRAGYKIGSSLRFGEIAVVLVRVYNIEGKLPENYTETDAIALAVNEKILDKIQDANMLVQYVYGVDLIRRIPKSPGFIPRTVLLPRIPVEPVISYVE